MPSIVSTSGLRSATSAEREEQLRHLPTGTSEAFHRFHATGDPVALDTVLFAVLDHFVPHRPGSPLATLPGSSRLVDDLGFDSLVVTEVVFFLEDLFLIRISHEEIVPVRTLDELRRFFRHKVSAHRVNR